MSKSKLIASILAVLSFAAVLSAQRGTPVTIRLSELSDNPPTVAGKRSQPAGASSDRVAAKPGKDSRPTAETIDMRPAAVCQRQMYSEWQQYLTDNDRYVKMDVTALKALHDRAVECVPMLPQGAPLRSWMLMLDQVSSNYGAALAVEHYQKVEVDRDSARAERDSVLQDREALVDRYNALVRQYNSLVVRHNALIDSAQTYMASIDKILASFSSHSVEYRPPSFVVPRAATELNCTAIALAGNMASINCW
jgi:hypothetical protein